MSTSIATLCTVSAVATGQSDRDHSGNRAQRRLGAAGLGDLDPVDLPSVVGPYEDALDADVAGLGRGGGLAADGLRQHRERPGLVVGQLGEVRTLQHPGGGDRLVLAQRVLEGVAAEDLLVLVAEVP